MNIFVLDADPKIAATYHNDKHVVKMVLETTQLLFTALHGMGYATVYKPTHKNHPSTKWTATSRDNFVWLRELGLALCDEYSYRYGKEHKCHSLIRDMVIPDEEMFKTTGLTSFAQAMPDIYKDKDPVVAYRKYYIGAKSGMLKYTKREMPDWLKENNVLLGIG